MLHKDYIPGWQMEIFLVSITSQQLLDPSHWASGIKFYGFKAAEPEANHAT
jgi:hypothetical protein